MEKSTFSLNDYIEPRFKYTDIKINKNKLIENYGIPKQSHKLYVDKNGLVRYK